jgi:hypothetical protein
MGMFGKSSTKLRIAAADCADNEKTAANHGEK